MRVSSKNLSGDSVRFIDQLPGFGPATANAVSGALGLQTNSAASLLHAIDENPVSAFNRIANATLGGKRLGEKRAATLLTGIGYQADADSGMVQQRNMYLPSGVLNVPEPYVQSVRGDPLAELQNRGVPALLGGDPSNLGRHPLSNQNLQNPQDQRGINALRREQTRLNSRVPVSGERSIPGRSAEAPRDDWSFLSVVQKKLADSIGMLDSSAVSIGEVQEFDFLDMNPSTGKLESRKQYGFEITYDSAESGKQVHRVTSDARYGSLFLGASRNYGGAYAVTDIAHAQYRTNADTGLKELSRDDAGNVAFNYEGRLAVLNRIVTKAASGRKEDQIFNSIANAGMPWVSRSGLSSQERAKYGGPTPKSSDMVFLDAKNQSDRMALLESVNNERTKVDRRLTAKLQHGLAYLRGGQHALPQNTLFRSSFLRRFERDLDTGEMVERFGYDKEKRIQGLLGKQGPLYQNIGGNAIPESTMGFTLEGEDSAFSGVKMRTVRSHTAIRHPEGQIYAKPLWTGSLSNKTYYGEGVSNIRAGQIYGDATHLPPGVAEGTQLAGTSDDLSRLLGKPVPSGTLHYIEAMQPSDVGNTVAITSYTHEASYKTRSKEYTLHTQDSARTVEIDGQQVTADLFGTIPSAKDLGQFAMHAIGSAYSTDELRSGFGEWLQGQQGTEAYDRMVSNFGDSGFDTANMIDAGGRINPYAEELFQSYAVEKLEDHTRIARETDFMAERLSVEAHMRSSLASEIGDDAYKMGFDEAYSAYFASPTANKYHARVRGQDVSGDLFTPGSLTPMMTNDKGQLVPTTPSQATAFHVGEMNEPVTDIDYLVRSRPEYIRKTHTVTAEHAQYLQHNNPAAYMSLVRREASGAIRNDKAALLSGLRMSQDPQFRESQQARILDFDPVEYEQARGDVDSTQFTDADGNVKVGDYNKAVSAAYGRRLQARAKSAGIRDGRFGVRVRDPHTKRESILMNPQAAARSQQVDDQGRQIGNFASSVADSYAAANSLVTTYADSDATRRQALSDAFQTAVNDANTDVEELFTSRDGDDNDPLGEALGFTINHLGGGLQSIPGLDPNTVVASIEAASRQTGISQKQLREMTDYDAMIKKHGSLEAAAEAGENMMTGQLYAYPFDNPAFGSPTVKMQWFEDMQAAEDPRVAGMETPAGFYMSQELAFSGHRDFDRDTGFLDMNYAKVDGEVVGASVAPLSNAEVRRRAKVLTESEVDKAFEKAGGRRDSRALFRAARDTVTSKKFWKDKGQIQQAYRDYNTGKAEIGPAYNTAIRSMHMMTRMVAESTMGDNPEAIKALTEASGAIGSLAYQYSIDSSIGSADGSRDVALDNVLATPTINWNSKTKGQGRGSWGRVNVTGAQKDKEGFTYITGSESEAGLFGFLAKQVFGIGGGMDDAAYREKIAPNIALMAMMTPEQIADAQRRGTLDTDVAELADQLTALRPKGDQPGDVEGLMNLMQKSVGAKTRMGVFTGEGRGIGAVPAMFSWMQGAMAERHAEKSGNLAKRIGFGIMDAARKPFQSARTLHRGIAKPSNIGQVLAANAAGIEQPVAKRIAEQFGVTPAGPMEGPELPPPARAEVGTTPSGQRVRKSGVAPRQPNSSALRPAAGGGGQKPPTPPSVAVAAPEPPKKPSNMNEWVQANPMPSSDDADAMMRWVNRYESAQSDFAADADQERRSQIGASAPSETFEDWEAAHPAPTDSSQTEEYYKQYDEAYERLVPSNDGPATLTTEQQAILDDSNTDPGQFTVKGTPSISSARGGGGRGWDTGFGGSAGGGGGVPASRRGNSNAGGGGGRPINIRAPLTDVEMEKLVGLQQKLKGLLTLPKDQLAQMDQRSIDVAINKFQKLYNQGMSRRVHDGRGELPYRTKTDDAFDEAFSDGADVAEMMQQLKDSGITSAAAQATMDATYVKRRKEKSMTQQQYWRSRKQITEVAGSGGVNLDINGATEGLRSLTDSIKELVTVTKGATEVTSEHAKQIGIVADKYNRVSEMAEDLRAEREDVGGPFADAKKEQIYQTLWGKPVTRGGKQYDSLMQSLEGDMGELNRINEGLGTDIDIKETTQDKLKKMGVGAYFAFSAMHRTLGFTIGGIQQDMQRDASYQRTASALMGDTSSGMTMEARRQNRLLIQAQASRDVFGGVENAYNTVLGTEAGARLYQAGRAGVGIGLSGSIAANSIAGMFPTVAKGLGVASVAIGAGIVGMQAGAEIFNAASGRDIGFSELPGALGIVMGQGLRKLFGKDKLNLQDTSGFGRDLLEFVAPSYFDTSKERANAIKDRYRDMSDRTGISIEEYAGGELSFARSFGLRHQGGQSDRERQERVGEIARNMGITVEDANKMITSTVRNVTPYGGSYATNLFDQLSASATPVEDSLYYQLTGSMQQRLMRSASQYASDSSLGQDEAEAILKVWTGGGTDATSIARGDQMVNFVSQFQAINGSTITRSDAFSLGMQMPRNMPGQIEASINNAAAAAAFGGSTAQDFLSKWGSTLFNPSGNTYSPNVLASNDPRFYQRFDTYMQAAGSREYSGSPQGFAAYNAMSRQARENFFVPSDIAAAAGYGEGYFDQAGVPFMQQTATGYQWATAPSAVNQDSFNNLLPGGQRAAGNLFGQIIRGGLSQAQMQELMDQSSNVFTGLAGNQVDVAAQYAQSYINRGESIDAARANLFGATYSPTQANRIMSGEDMFYKYGQLNNPAVRDVLETAGSQMNDVQFGGFQQMSQFMMDANVGGTQAAQMSAGYMAKMRGPQNISRTMSMTQQLYSMGVEATSALGAAVGVGSQNMSQLEFTRFQKFLSGDTLEYSRFAMSSMGQGLGLKPLVDPNTGMGIFQEEQFAMQNRQVQMGIEAQNFGMKQSWQNYNVNHAMTFGGSFINPATGQNTTIGRGQLALDAAQMELGNRQQEWNFSFNRRQMDVSYQQSTESMGVEREQSAVRYGWQVHDWARNESKSQLNFAWGMEDINEQIRFSSGRERRTLMRQRDRMTIQEGMRREDSDTERSRMEKQRQWQLEAEERQKKYFEQNFKFQEESLEKQKQFYEEGKLLREEERQMRVMQAQINDAMQKADLVFRQKQMVEQQQMQLRELQISQEITRRQGEMTIFYTQTLPNMINGSNQALTNMFNAINTAATSSATSVGNSIGGALGVLQNAANIINSIRWPTGSGGNSAAIGIGIIPQPNTTVVRPTGTGSSLPPLPPPPAPGTTATPHYPPTTIGTVRPTGGAGTAVTGLRSDGGMMGGSSDSEILGKILVQLQKMEASGNVNLTVNTDEMHKAVDLAANMMKVKNT